MIRFGHCCICGHFRWLRFTTPDDPPFYPKGGGHHCGACERWLLTGDEATACKHCGYPPEYHDRYDYCPWYEGFPDPTTQYEPRP